MMDKKLLAIHQGALGDVITSFTALLFLRETYSRTDLICRQTISRMAEHLRVIDRGFALESAAFSNLFIETLDNIDMGFKNFFQAYDEIVLFSFSKMLAENLKKISGKKIIQIPPRPAPGEPIQAGRYLISWLVAEKILKKETEINCLRVHQDFRKSNFKDRKIFIHPGSGSPLKNWPLQYFFKLEKLLRESAYEPVFVLGPAEDGVSEILKKNDNRLKKQTFQLYDPVELVDTLITGCGFIGNDSGVSHLAAFLGLPTLVIFGPTDPSRWTPMGRSVKIISSSSCCDYCFETLKKGCKSMDCLTAISPRQVLEKFNMWIF
ncbi:MAG: glycosyltransferase family 9 protein [Desulfobacterales bacterium]